MFPWTYDFKFCSWILTNYNRIVFILCIVHGIQLKELEKLGPKKGVISQSVKDVIQSLVDDDLVFKDKIGTSVSIFDSRNINWRFASEYRPLRLFY